MYQKMIKHITVADIILDDVGSAASEIDRVLESKLPCQNVIHTVWLILLYSNALPLQTGVSSSIHLQ